MLIVPIQGACIVQCILLELLKKIHYLVVSLVSRI